MANAVYVPYRNGVLGSHATRVDLDADTIKAVLIDHGTDTPNVDHRRLLQRHQHRARRGAALGFTTKTIGTVAAGVFDADNVTFTAVSGNSVESVNILKDTGTPRPVT